MEFAIPTALVANLHCMSICFSFKMDQDQAGIAGFVGDARLLDDSWIHLNSEFLPPTETRPSRWHLHIDLQRTFGSSKKAATNQLSDLRDHMNLGPGQGVDSTLVQSIFRIAVDALPQSGVIQPFIGIAVSSTFATMAIRGVTYNVDEAEVDELSWKLLRDSKTVEVSLKSRRALTMAPSLLVDLQAQQSAIFRQLVLEQS